jgi:hypothetical protein
MRLLDLNVCNNLTSSQVLVRETGYSSKPECDTFS